MAESNVEYIILGCVVTKEMAEKFEQKCAENHITTDKAIGLFVAEFIKDYINIASMEKAQNDKDEGE